MAKMEIEKIKLELSQDELSLIKKALNYHITEDYDHEREMRILLSELEG